MRNRLQKMFLAWLVFGLVLAAFIVPWSLSTINKSNELLRQQQEMLTPPAPSTQGIAVDERTLDEQFARTKVAERDTVAIHRPARPARVSEPYRSAYSIVPQSSPELRPVGRTPRLKMERRPAQRILRSYGWIDVPERTIPVPCGS